MRSKIEKALEAARLAYEFGRSSYAYYALAGIISVKGALESPPPRNYRKWLKGPEARA